MVMKKEAASWNLIGKKTISGWRILSPIGWDSGSEARPIHVSSDGGNSSVPYIVEKDGKKAFLKAIDLTSLLESPNIMKEMIKITEAHKFETEILEICKKAKMNKIVISIDSGQIDVGPNLQDKVPYLIFELAEGDVRKQIKLKSDSHKLSWWLRAMHHATTGLSQLHTNGIAHQDLKPSNVLNFYDDTFKISDLGRSVNKFKVGPYDDDKFSGDWRYVPPEIAYNYINPDSNERRLSTDIYLLGSLIFYFVTGIGATQLLIDELPFELRPATYNGGKWSVGYTSILPTLQTKFTEMLNEIEKKISHPAVKPSLVKAAYELANPNPDFRGHPLTRRNSSNKYSLERYISLFDILSKKAQIRLT